MGFLCSLTPCVSLRIGCSQNSLSCSQLGNPHNGDRLKDSDGKGSNTFRMDPLSFLFIFTSIFSSLFLVAEECDPKKKSFIWHLCSWKYYRCNSEVVQIVFRRKRHRWCFRLRRFCKTTKIHFHVLISISAFPCVLNRVLD